MAGTIKKVRPTVNMNWQEKRNDEAAISFIQDGNSDFIYILNPTLEAIDIALAAGKKVVARIFDPFGNYSGGNSFDNGFHYLHTPEETYQWFMHSPFARYKGKEVYWIIGMNEPSANNTDDIVAGLEWAKGFGSRMILSGHKVALGGWNISKSLRMGFDNDTGSATAPDVDNGKWDDLLKFAQHNREDVILDIHVYTVGRAWGQLVSGFPNDIASMNNPPERLEWGQRLNGGHYAYWHVGRSNPLFVRMEEIGCPDVRFGVGECIWDNMDDIRNIVQNMRTEFGLPEYMNDMRGILSLRKYYAYLADVKYEDYTDTMFGTDAFRDMTWVDDVYPKNFEYFAVFSWTTNHFWTAYDTSHPTMFHFINLMKTYEGRTFEDGNPLPDPDPIPEPTPDPDPTDVPMPPPEDDGWALGIFTFEGLRFREQPSLSGDYIVMLAGVYQGMLNKSPSIMATGYSWVAVYIESLDEYGWVAEWSLTDLNAQFFMFEDAPVPDPIPDPTPIPAPDSEKRYFIDLVTFTATISHVARLEWMLKLQDDKVRTERLLTILENAQPIEGNS